jgi:CheY-like chemotaxis protein
MKPRPHLRLVKWFALMGTAFRIMLVALVLWDRPLCPAAEPLPLADAMHEQSALGSALTNQFAQPGGEASAAGSHAELNLAVALLIAAVLAVLRLPPLVLRRVRSCVPKLTGPDDLALSLLEEPSVLAFFESLKEGPAGPVAAAPSLAAQAQAPPSGPASDAAPDRLQEFYDSTPRRLAEFRTLVSESSQAPDATARQTKLLESFERASALRESAGLPEVLPIWQVVFALEGLLKRLSTKPAELSPSVVRTMGGALDLLERLCHQRMKPDLATEPPVRILAVDDDPISRCAMSLALAKVFNSPDLAPDGPTALSLVAGQTYDVIFLDVEMPGMDGFEVCTKIHETELNCNTPVVFVTRHSDFASRTKSTLSGGYSLLGKPFMVFEVTLKAITLVLEGRLGRGAAEPRTASNEDSNPTLGLRSAPAFRVPVPAVPTAWCASRQSPAGEEPAPQAGRHVQPPGELNTANSSLARGLSAPLPPSDDLAPTGHPTGNSSKSQCHIPEKACAPGLDKALSLEALAPLLELQHQLQAAQQDAKPAGHLEFLGDLYLAVHAVCFEAQHAALDAAFRLGSALESMLKKLLEHPKSWTPSNVQAAAAALDLFLDVCRTGANPDLAQPPVQLLVVDDDPVARRAISGTLQLAFGRPDSAESGEAALRLAREKPFDLIFLDVQMPGMDGFAACSRIHQTRCNHLTPVVFITGSDDPDSRAKAATSGGCGFVSKQVMASQLKLVALSFILRSRLGAQIPTLEAPAALTDSGSDPASPESAGREDPSLARALGAVN